MLQGNDKIKISGSYPPWIMAVGADLEGMLRRGHFPQALMIHGMPGTGRRYLALWLAGRLLGVPVAYGARFAECEVGDEPDAQLVHPDLMLVQPPHEKAMIQVESIRDVTAFLQLKSHQGGARIAIVWPAEGMTGAAANSLLKTLEEPPEGSVLVLVAAAPATLPPTIVSRCHRLHMPRPSRSVSLGWLRSYPETADWDTLLDFGAGAPLRALALQRSGFARQAADFASDFAKLRQRLESPAVVARKWAAADRDVLARWLYLQASGSLAQTVATVTADVSGNGPLQNQQKQTNMKIQMQRLRDVEELYRNRFKALSMEVQLAALLQGWHGESAGRG